MQQAQEHPGVLAPAKNSGQTGSGSDGQCSPSHAAPELQGSTQQLLLLLLDLLLTPLAACKT